MQELGGNIKLDGFEEVEPAQQIVMKKIIGNAVKEFGEKITVKEFILTLKEKTVTADLNSIYKETSKGDNLFYVLNEVLTKIKKKL